MPCNEDGDEVADLKRQVRKKLVMSVFTGIRNRNNKKLVLSVFTGIGMLGGWVSAQLFGWEPLTLVGAGVGVIVGIVICFKYVR
jgi:hypothetical protein